MKIEMPTMIGIVVIYLLTALILMVFWNYVVFEVFFPLYFLRTMNYVQALISTTFFAMLYFYLKDRK